MFTLVNRQSGFLQQLLSRDANELRLVLIGKTGDGKSATGNQIFGQKVFKSTACAGSVTPKCSEQSCSIDGRNIMIVDTPGLFDTSIENDEIKNEILKFIAITSPGPHVFLLTIAAGRYTEESNKTHEYVKKLLGNEADKHTIIVFTRKDDLENDDITVNEFIENVPDGLRNLLDNVGRRYVFVNNRLPLRADSLERLEQIKELISKVEDLVQTNHGSVYSSQVYASSERALKTKTKQKDERVHNDCVKEAEAVHNGVKERVRKLERVKSTKSAGDLTLHRLEQELHLAVEEGKQEVKKIQEKCKEGLQKNRDELRKNIMLDKVSVKEPWFTSKVKPLKRLF